MRRVIFLGFGYTNRNFNKEGYEIWTCNDWWLYYPYLIPNRVYQAHKNFNDEKIKEIQKVKGRFYNYEKYYNLKDIEYIFIEKPQIKCGKYRIFNKENIIKRFGKSFFVNTFSYMFIDAINEKINEIVFVGVDLISQYEYCYQVHGIIRNIELARRNGIDVIACNEKKWKEYIKNNKEKEINKIYGE